MDLLETERVEEALDDYTPEFTNMTVGKSPFFNIFKWWVLHCHLSFWTGNIWLLEGIGMFGAGAIEAVSKL